MWSKPSKLTRIILTLPLWLATIIFVPLVGVAIWVGQYAPLNVGGMFGIYFAEKCPGTYDEVLACDKEAFNRFFHAMLDAGVYLAPSAFEAGFVSAAHTAADIDATLAHAEAAFALVR